MKLAVRIATVVYLVILLMVWGFMRFDTGGWWPLTLFLFSPRWVVALPLLVLVPVTLAVQSRLALVYILHVFVIVIPIMDCRLAWSRRDGQDAGLRLNVMTCNLGGGDISINHLVALAKTHKIHVLMFQECASSIVEPVYEKLGWFYQRGSNNAIGSCYELGELQVLARRAPDQYNSIVAIACELRIPAGHPSFSSKGTESLESPESALVRIVDVHFPTFRPAFEVARAFGTNTGTAIETLGSQYNELAEQVLQQVQESEIPTIIGGDFNAPCESAYYRNYWFDYQNALSKVGTGLRYTKLTRIHGVRIDHVLTDSHWTINSAVVGPDVGGDHRPVIVELSLSQ